MKKLTIIIVIITLLTLGIMTGIDMGIENMETKVEAQSRVHTVQSGDSLWKIAVRYQAGLSEIISVNKHIKNPDLIYPGQKITIPEAPPYKAMEDEIIRLVNIERQNRGLGRLSYDWQVARVARIKSQDMIENNYFSHTSPVYGSPFNMLKAFNIRYTTAAENIAYGQRSAREVVNSWMNSPGHRQNILNTNVTKIGVGIAKNYNGVLYFTQMFIR
ncbi:MAG: SafA/ExsA family spore coat assembly protein [Bacillota bacterium]